MKALFPIYFLLAAAASAGGYRIAATYPIGGAGSYDYIRFDARRHRLFVSHQNRVEVLHADTGLPAGAIVGLHGVHGVALADDLGKGFISNGLNGAVTEFDLLTLGLRGTIRTGGEKPDAIEYDPSSRTVIVSNGRSHSESLIDAKGGEVRHLVPLAGNPESVGYDGHGRAFVDLESHNSVAVIDLATGQVQADWPVAPGEGPTGLAVDAAGGRLIVSCGGNGKIVVLDEQTGRRVAVLPIGDDSDGAAFDPKAHRAFSSNRDGTLTIVQEAGPDHFQVRQNLRTQPGARTLAIDPATGRVFLPVAQFAPGRDEDHPGPAMPGTFKILVVSGQAPPAR